MTTLHIGKEVEHAEYGQFLKKILGSLEAASRSSGSETGQQIADAISIKRQKLDDNAVLDARFALGADSGAYLRTNVMPLYTTGGDRRPLSKRLFPEVERAGRIGVLHALEDEIKRQFELKRREMRSALELCGWLLTLPEVRVFVKLHLDQINDPPTDVEVAKGLIGMFNSIILEEEASLVLAGFIKLPEKPSNDSNWTARCRIVRILLLLFEEPMDDVDSQWKAFMASYTEQTSNAQKELEALGITTYAPSDDSDKMKDVPPKTNVYSTVESEFKTHVKAIQEKVKKVKEEMEVLTDQWTQLDAEFKDIQNKIAAKNAADQFGDELPSGVTKTVDEYEKDATEIQAKIAKINDEIAKLGTTPAIDYTSTLKLDKMDLINMYFGAHTYDAPLDDCIKRTGEIDKDALCAALKQLSGLGGPSDGIFGEIQKHGEVEIAFPTNVDKNTHIPPLLAFMTGIFAERAPHHAGNGTKLHYNIPQVAFPFETKTQVTYRSPQEQRAIDDEYKKEIFKYNKQVSVNEFQRVFEKPDESVARWAPVKSNVDGTFSADYSRNLNVVTTNAFFEYMVDFYASKSDTSAAARAAAAKIRQLRPMAETAKACKQNPNLFNPFPEDGDKQAFFLSRPVKRCDDNVLYSFDYGLYAYKMSKAQKFEYKLTEESIKNWRSKFSTYTWKHLDCNDTTLDAGQLVKLPYPFFLAAPPGTTIGNDKPKLDMMFKQPTQRNFETIANRFPLDINLLRPERLKAALEGALEACLEFKELQAREDCVKNEIRIASETTTPSAWEDPDDAARLRREAVWNDGLREAAISSDRLYAFVRHLSGTISESVDAICQIDEGMLIKQQQELRSRRNKGAEEAAREHMQLVRGVFSGILKESGLALGIGQGSDMGNIKIFSNTLRKQVDELSQKGSESGGFFKNTVKLEQLLTQGSGEMSLTQLFERLREAGVAMQQASLASESFDSSGVGMSLDFLSAPRNSLMLRYKPDALSAIRTAYTRFQNEMDAQHDFLHRPLSVYELVEGRDENLTTEFASFCAHVLANARMFSSSIAPYVGKWPAITNANQMRISLRRLIATACRYIHSGNPPNFLDDNGRRDYFS
jgi:hypothetical protein